MHHAIESLRLRAIPHAVDAARAEQRIQAMRAMPAMVHGSVELERVDDRLIAVRVRQLQAHHFGGFSGTRQVVNGAVLAGLIRQYPDTVNMVNAPYLAKERWPDIRSIRHEKEGVYTTLILVTVLIDHCDLPFTCVTSITLFSMSFFPC